MALRKYINGWTVDKIQSGVYEYEDRCGNYFIVTRLPTEKHGSRAPWLLAYDGGSVLMDTKRAARRAGIERCVDDQGNHYRAD